ncbi:hypothetical protein BDV93DRAFT_540884 [Ceratobasidium sp. AG-I]|nr:hypothetical protein BDV93DRAFT_540884 [Ceratobasidium sp. AG-I]
MEYSEDAPIYYVNDFEDDSDAHSISTTTSGSTNQSMSILTSEEASEYFQQIHGRVFPLAPNTPLFFPTNDVEVQRLDFLHAAVKRVLNGNYYGPVKDVLSETGDRRERALDWITGEGNWVREMAAEFPHVDFTSVDNIPLVPHVRFPNILGYEAYDLPNGIQEADESFDLVHVRHTTLKIRDLAALVLEIYRVLRPGGLLIWSEVDGVPRDATSLADHSGRIHSTRGPYECVEGRSATSGPAKQNVAQWKRVGKSSGIHVNAKCGQNATHRTVASRFTFVRYWRSNATGSMPNVGQLHPAVHQRRLE